MLLFLVILITLVSCQSRTQDTISATSEPKEPTAESISDTEPSTVESTSPPTPEESSEPESPSSAEEVSSEAAAYEPSELLGWQVDPTTTQDAFLMLWEHLEYRLFGNPEDYIDVESEFKYIRSDGSFHDDGMPMITVGYRLPSICVTQENVLDIDLNFSNDVGLKIGEIPTIYYELQPGEDPFHMPDGIFSRDGLISSASEEQPPAEIITQDNVIGGVWQTEKFIRGISGSYDSSVTLNKPDGSVDRVVEFPPNHTVMYHVLLDETKLGLCYFYVSPQATTEELRLYDAIAESMHVVSN
jgi:hypothetical protein